LNLPSGFPSLRFDLPAGFPTFQPTIPTVSRRFGPPEGFPFDVTGKVDHPDTFHKPET
jgi:hypothetical protein